MHRFKFIAIIICLISSLTFVQGTEQKELAGAGSSFANPVYSKWAKAYEKATGSKIEFLPVGSGAGLKQIKGGTVDFGATDKPLTSDELQKDGLFQFPAVMGGIVISYNLKEIKSNTLKLSGPVLADIYLGKIKKWNDDRIKELNPHLAMPDTNIKVIYRNDESGTTFIFTTYLSEISQDWKEKVGADTDVSWPVGDGAEGNEGVASLITNIPGAIGYVEYSYAKDNKISTAKLQNRDGEFISPTIDSFKAAATHADWDKAKDFYLILTNQPGKDSWPITAATYVVLHKKSEDPKAALDVLSFYNWSFKNGDSLTKDLSYVTLPESLKDSIRKAWQQELTDTSGTNVCGASEIQQGKC